jgi:2-polyprenyl-3-methyl-5-hydroxy-6-metoxy-1,4-benzoquinol methylase
MPAIFARGFFGLPVLTDVLRPDAYPSNFFDAVTAFQMFEHLLNPGEVLATIGQVLKPGGLLAVEVPNIETWLVWFLKGHHRHFVEDHVSFFSAQTLGQLLCRHGFQVRHVSYPARVLSLQHLAQWWIGRYAGRPVGLGLVRLLGRLKIENWTVRVNLGDIVMIIGQKTPA